MITSDPVVKSWRPFLTLSVLQKVAVLDCKMFIKLLSRDVIQNKDVVELLAVEMTCDFCG